MSVMGNQTLHVSFWVLQRCIKPSESRSQNIKCNSATSVHAKNPQGLAHWIDWGLWTQCHLVARRLWDRFDVRTGLFCLQFAYDTAVCLVHTAAGHHVLPVESVALHVHVWLVDSVNRVCYKCKIGLSQPRKL